MFRFTIRDVLWLTVVVGLGVGWWIDHRRAADQLHVAAHCMDRLVVAMENLEARVGLGDKNTAATILDSCATEK